MLRVRSDRGRLGAAVGALGLAVTAAAQPAVRPVALSGQPAPGFTNRTFTSFGQPVVGTTGQIWFVATVTGPGPGPTTVLYRADAALPPQPIFTNGEVPGLGPNRTWGGWQNLAPGAHGELAFQSGVARLDMGDSYSALFRYDQGTLELNATTLPPEPAPGRPQPFGGWTSIACSPGLQLAVKGVIGSVGNNTGLWGGSRPLGLAVFEGEPVFGLPDGVTWGDTEGPGSPSIGPSMVQLVNASGTLAYKTSLSGAVTVQSNEAIWTGGALFPQLVVREGDPVVASGAPEGATWWMLGPPSINNRGEVAFLGVMAGGGVTSANDEGLFVGTPGNLTMVLREDDAAPGLQGPRLHERDSTLNVWTFRNVSINDAGDVGFVTGLFGPGISNANDSVAYVGEPGDWTLVARQGEAAAGGADGDVYGDIVDMGITREGDVAFVTVLNGVNRALVAGPLGQHGLVARRNGTVQVGPGDVRTITSVFNDFQFAIAGGGSDGRARSLSNVGNLAFRARFNGGTEGVFEATLRPVVQPPGDRDGDGLRDDWELGPIDVNDDGVDDINLAALGANPDHKDLFLEVDAQAGLVPGITALDLLVLAFDAAPVSNPDGVPGITLHIWISDVFAGPPLWTAFDPDGFPVEYYGFRNLFACEEADRSDPNFVWRVEARRRAMRYMMVIDRVPLDAYHGLAETYGNDSVVVLGHPSMAADVDRAAVMMHELGHMLGLRHGGTDEVQLKPNYPSVMNYALAKRYPFSDGFWQLDYCREALPTLRETMLDETAGVGSPGSRYAGYRMPYGSFERPAAPQRDVSYVRLDGSPTDFGNPFGFSRDGVFGTQVIQDLNQLPPDCPIPDCAGTSFGDVMTSQNDWARVTLRVGVTGAFAASRVERPSAREPNPASSAWIEANLPRPPGSCGADFDRSGAVDLADIFAFLRAWFSNSPWADFDRSGGAPGIGDIFAFLSAWFGGC